jgi:hypothetical protein
MATARSSDNSSNGGATTLRYIYLLKKSIKTPNEKLIKHKLIKEVQLLSRNKPKFNKQPPETC